MKVMHDTENSHYKHGEGNPNSATQMFAHQIPKYLIELQKTVLLLVIF